MNLNLNAHIKYLPWQLSIIFLTAWEPQESGWEEGRGGIGTLGVASSDPFTRLTRATRAHLFRHECRVIRYQYTDGAGGETIRPQLVHPQMKKRQGSEVVLWLGQTQRGLGSVFFFLLINVGRAFVHKRLIWCIGVKKYIKISYRPANEVLRAKASGEIEFPFSSFW